MYNVVRPLNKRPANIVVKSKKSGSKNNKKRMSDCITENHYSKYKIEGLNKNFFTDLIDKMMMDEFFDEKFKVKFDEVCKTRPDKKRLAILGKIDNGKGIIADIKALKDNYVPKMTHIEDIIEMLRKYVRYGMVSKTKEFGEVATPLELVRDMVKSIPDNNDEIWGNPNLKWLDPCNGTGPFLSMVIRKLMKGLENWEPNEEERYKHIVEKMIYCCEIQPKNMFLWMFFADPYDQYLLNVYPDSYLDKGFDNHMKNVWGIEKFDIIIGNPPYQDAVGKNGNTEPLWDTFVNRSLELLKEGGYLCMVHPSGWRSPDGRFRYIYDEFKKRNLIYLCVNDYDQGKTVFGVGTNFDYYVIHNTQNNHDSLTEVKIGKWVRNGNKLTNCEDKTEFINLNNYSFIPNGMFDIYNSLIAAEGEPKVNVLHDYTYEHRKKILNKEQNGEFKLPVVYTITQKNGIKLLYSCENNGHFGTPKVIWSNGAGTYPIVDKDGKYGMTGYSYGIVDSIENLESIKAALESKRFIEIMKSAGSGFASKYDFRIIGTFRKDFWKDFI